jgi:Ca-activated chloride channel family protein
MERRASKRGSALLLGSIMAIATVLVADGQKKLPDKPPDNQDIDVIKVDTTLVTVPVTIKQHGKVVADLKPENIHIYEDGVEQTIVYFDSPDRNIEGENYPRSGVGGQKPLTVALMLDTSDSTEFRLKPIQDAAAAFADLLQPDDRMLLMSFDKNVRVISNATNDRAALRSGIDQLRTGGGTSLYEAMDSVMTWFNHIGGRKAVVVLTDGVDTASPKATYESTLSSVAKSDVVIYPIQYDTYSDFADNPSRQSVAVGGITTMSHATKNGEAASEAYKRARTYLSELARLSGGTLRFSDSVKNLSKSFAQIAAQLREQYTLGYYPTNKTANGVPRKIKITVDRPEVNVATRKSYIYAQRN